MTKFNINTFKIAHDSDLLLKVKHKKMIKSESGIIVDLHPMVVEDRETKGEVLQIKEKTSEEYCINVGDIVFFPKHAGIDLYLEDSIEENGEEYSYKYMLINVKDVIGKMIK